MATPRIAIIVTVILIIGIIVGLSVFQYVQQTALFETFFTDEDFTIPKPALVKQKDICVEAYGSLTCEDEDWIIYKEFDTGRLGSAAQIFSDFSYEDQKLVLRSYGKPVQAIFKKDMRNRDVKVTFREEIQGLEGGNVKMFFQEKEVFSTSSSGERGWLIELIADAQDESLYRVAVNGQPTQDIKIDLKIPARLKIFSLTGGGILPTRQTTSTIVLHTIKSKPQLSCQVEEDEVSFTDRFCENTLVRLSYSPNAETLQLSHRPKNFCPDTRPIVVRNIDDGGERADVLGTLYNKLSRGDIVTVEPGTILEVEYITDYTQGMASFNCPVDHCLNNNRQCVKKIFEKKDILPPAANETIIEPALGTPTFEGSITVGDKAITSSPPQYLCAGEKPKANAPDPRPDCWSVNLQYGKDRFTLNPSQERELDRFFSIVWSPSAQYKEGSVQSDYKNFFTLKQKNHDLLQLQITDATVQNSVVDFEKPASVSYQVKNNYGSFAKEQAGLYVTEKKGLLGAEKSYFIEEAFPAGTTNRAFQANTSEFGDLKYDFVAYFKIGDTYFFDNEKLTRQFLVVSGPPVTPFPGVPANETPVEPFPGLPRPPVEPKPKSKVIGTLAFIAIILAIVVVVAFYRRRSLL